MAGVLKLCDTATPKVTHVFIRSPTLPISKKQKFFTWLHGENMGLNSITTFLVYLQYDTESSFSEMKKARKVSPASATFSESAYIKRKESYQNLRECGEVQVFRNDSSKSKLL
jgi:hypothetical protein